MGRYYTGMVVRTSYNTGPYRILDITENCRCPSFMDSITLMDKAPASRPHVHLTCRKVGEKTGFFYLSGYDDTLHSVWNSDYLIDCAQETLLIIITLL